MYSRIRPYGSTCGNPTGWVMVSAEAEEGIDLRESGLDRPPPVAFISEDVW